MTYTKQIPQHPFLEQKLAGFKTELVEGTMVITSIFNMGIFYNSSKLFYIHIYTCVCLYIGLYTYTYKHTHTYTFCFLYLPSSFYLEVPVRPQAGPYQRKLIFSIVHKFLILNKVFLNYFS